MKKSRDTLSMVLLSVATIAILSQLLVDSADKSLFSLGGVILLIFILSYLIARLYQEYK